MATVVRAFLWLLILVAPGGVFLLPFLVGDAMAQRKRRGAQDSLPDSPLPGGVGALDISPASTR